MTAKQLMQDYEIEKFNESQTAKIVSIRKKRMEKENAKKIAFKNFTNMLGSVAIVLIIAALFSSYVYKNSLVNEAKYDIFNLKAEIKSLGAQIEELNANIENQTELENIEKIATDTLNMIYPSKEQMVTIDSTYHFALATATPEATASAGDETQEEVADKKPIIEELVSAIFNANN